MYTVSAASGCVARSRSDASPMQCQESGHAWYKPARIGIPEKQVFAITYQMTCTQSRAWTSQLPKSCARQDGSAPDGDHARHHTRSVCPSNNCSSSKVLCSAAATPLWLSMTLPGSRGTVSTPVKTRRKEQPQLNERYNAHYCQSKKLRTVGSQHAAQCTRLRCIYKSTRSSHMAPRPRR